MMIRKTTLFALLGLCGACASDAKTEPTWAEDIQPLVQANCVRCHAPPSIGGAPTDFRLDVYEDTVLEDGRVIRGAKTMAPFMAARAGELGSMPPNTALPGSLRDTFSNWITADAPQGTRAGNSEPRMLLLSELEAADQDPVRIRYELSDRDGDMVSGQLFAGDTLLVDDLQGGRGEASFFPGSLPEGSIPLVAELSDGDATVRRTVGVLEVSHQNGNEAPALSFETRVRDALFSDLQSPVALQIRVEDKGPTRVDVIAFRGIDERPVDENVPVIGGIATVNWDTTAIPEGPGWRLRVTATDTAFGVTTIESGSFVISHSSTTLGIADVAGILGNSCRGCHPFSLSGELGFSLDDISDDLHSTVDGLRGLIYRRAILEATMPPPSAEIVATASDDRWQPLSPADKATLAEYLLGGSPP